MASFGDEVARRKIIFLQSSMPLREKFAIHRMRVARKTVYYFKAMTENFSLISVLSEMMLAEIEEELSIQCSRQII